MKTIFALATAIFVGSAFAQTGTSGTATTSGTGSTGSTMADAPVAGQPKHMLSFGTDGSILGKLSFEKSKVKGSDADNDTNLDLAVNYA